MMTFKQYKQIEMKCGRKVAAMIYAHEIWANSNGARGVKANLSYADLRSTDLSYADLRSTDLSYADLRSTDLRSADLRSANFRFADLRSANFRFADLRSANFDYSAWPLWCGSLDVKIDKRVAAQLFYHACNAAQSIDDDEVRAAIAGCKDLANIFHREECERIK